MAMTTTKKIVTVGKAPVDGGFVCDWGTGDFADLYHSICSELCEAFYEDVPQEQLTDEQFDPVFMAASYVLNLLQEEGIIEVEDEE